MSKLAGFICKGGVAIDKGGGALMKVPAIAKGAGSIRKLARTIAKGLGNDKGGVAKGKVGGTNDKDSGH